MIRSVSFFFFNHHVEDETELRELRLPEEQLGGSYCHDPDKRLRKFLNLETEREVVSHRLGFLEADAETEFEVQDIN